VGFRVQGRGEGVGRAGGGDVRWSGEDDYVGWGEGAGVGGCGVGDEGAVEGNVAGVGGFGEGVLY
jgi:hypothetical protein